MRRARSALGRWPRPAHRSSPRRRRCGRSGCRRRARPGRPRPRVARGRPGRRTDRRRDDDRGAHGRPRRLRPPDGASSDRPGARVRLVVLAGAAIAAWLVLRRRGGDRRRVVVAWADGSELELGSGSPERRPAARDRRGRARVSAVDDLGRRLLDVALLEGDFTLRSGRRSRWYLDKYRFETDPDLLRALGDRLAAADSRGRAGRGPDRGTCPRCRRAGRRRGHGVRSAVHHRAR